MIIIDVNKEVLFEWDTYELKLFTMLNWICILFELQGMRQKKR